MRLIGTGTYDANRTTETNSLAMALLLKPEISANIVNLFEDNFSAFSSYLSRRGLLKKGLHEDFSSADFKVIGNRQVKWALKGHMLRKGTLVADAPETSAGKVGEGKTIFTIDLDTNFFSPNDVLELAGQRYLLQVLDEYPVEINANQWRYKVRRNDNKDGYIPSSKLLAGAEIGFSYTQFPEMSETGYEKNTYPEWHTEFLTIQRMQYSISGSANASVLWLEHNGQKLWCRVQEMEMMKRWAWARERQLLFGKATINENEEVYIKDLKGRDIVGGNGIVNQGDASLKMQYNTLTANVLENMMQNMQLLTTSEGVTELFVCAGQQFVYDFQRLMRETFKANPMPLLVGSGSDKGVNSTFTSYEMGGVKITVCWSKAFDAPFVPQERGSDGVNKGSKRAFFMSLGNTIGGDPMVELLALGNKNNNRKFVKKEITGMTSTNGSKSEVASTSMDGTQVQILSETGIALKNPFGFAELYVP